MLLLAENLQNLVDNLGVALLGYVIVFTALALIYGVFYFMPRLIDYLAKQRLRAQGRLEVAKKDTLGLTGAEGAAIAMALYLYLEELHDEESTKLTIKEVSRRYSPWSSKIHGMREVPAPVRRR